MEAGEGTFGRTADLKYSIVSISALICVRVLPTRLTGEQHDYRNG